MKKIHAVLGISAFLVINPAFPAAFQLYELATPMIATAGVGQAAVAMDASTAYFNPAGMTELPTSELMLGGQVILPRTYYDINKTHWLNSEKDSGESKATIPGFGLYYAYNYSTRIKLGLSLNMPYVGLLHYPNGRIGPYRLESAPVFYTLNLNPSLAYNMTDWASVGFGINIEYASLHQILKIPRLTSNRTITTDQANINIDNINAGFNLGLLLKPFKTTKIGLVYRSGMTHHLDGDTSIENVSDIPEVSTQLYMPQTIILSLDQTITAKFNLLAESGWTNWSKMQNAALLIDNITTKPQFDWKNTYRLGLGGQLKATAKLLLQAGISYDSAPTNASKLKINVPLDRQIRTGLGIIYNARDIAQIAMSYEYINLGHIDVEHTSQNLLIDSSLDNHWKNWANVIQLSVNFNL